jgi:hypothetical protein
MMSIHEAVPGRRAEALRALAANLVGGHLVVPTYVIAADAGIAGTRRACIFMQPIWRAGCCDNTCGAGVLLAPHVAVLVGFRFLIEGFRYA